MLGARRGHRKKLCEPIVSVMGWRIFTRCTTAAYSLRQNLTRSDRRILKKWAKRGQRKSTFDKNLSKNNKVMYCCVILIDRPLNPLTYQAIDGVDVGSVVQVPLGNKSQTGIVLEMTDVAPEGILIKPVIDVVEPEPIMTKAMAKMLIFMAGYYEAPLGLVLKLAMPGGMMRAGRVYYSAGNVVPADDEAREVVRKLGGASLTGNELTALTHTKRQFIECMAARGELAMNWVLEKARRTESCEAFYRVVEGAEPPKKLGAKQQQILDIVRGSQDGVRYREIKEKVEGALAPLKRLEELGLITSTEKTKDISSFDDVAPIVKEVSLTDEQSMAIQTIVEHKGYGGFLLHGVTGSGKTEVYMGVMEAVRKRGQSCILMLPEIALTPQFCAVFRGRFGDDVAVLHSGLSEIERYDTWNRIRTGRLHIAIGPRSALFAPVQDLGLIVVDEEHDSSFKQDETPRYHARDMALVLGRFAGCPVILGSATPSMESYARACEGKLTRLLLTRRPMARAMPSVEIIDMRNRQKPLVPDDLPADEKNNILLKNRLISEKLEIALKETLSRREQAIIFLNRRGFSSWLQCKYCGQPFYCPHCDVALTYHRYANLLRCHYCGFEQPLMQTCPKCGRPDIELAGFDTERIVEMLQECVPGARIDRLDRDRTSVKGIRAILENFKSGKTDILVGTQMVAKGHDIHNVTLVGIISADMSLNLPDFRASERTFQLLTQVSGRAGRGDVPGRVIIQAMRPDHPVLRYVVARDYEAYALEELAIRKNLGYPPFISMTMIRIDGENPAEVEQFSNFVAIQARGVMPVDGLLLGPAPAPIAVLGGRIRYQLFLKHPSREALHRWLAWLQAKTQNLRQKNSHIHVVIDVDPIGML